MIYWCSPAEVWHSVCECQEEELFIPKWTINFGSFMFISAVKIPTAFLQKEKGVMDPWAPCPHTTHPDEAVITTSQESWVSNQLFPLLPSQE